MKTLNLHCDYIKFKALKKALKNIDELSPGQKLEGLSKECLVILMAVEKGDNKQTVEKVVKDIKDISNQVKTKNIVLYPYAHLSKNLGSPEVAMSILQETAKNLKGFKVVQAPFGYYKSFELKVKGHPLSELSREFVVEGSEVEEDYDPKQLLREISKSKLDTSKLKENDHRILGRQMDLFSFHDVSPGMVFWHNNGLIARNELIKFWREEHFKAGYEEIKTPQILDKKLWQISGHWEKYNENNFMTEYEKRKFLIKPMNCPGGMLVFKNSPKSYRDLPLRVGELGEVHRQELSGVLAGLFRVVQFTQDDAHIYCTDKQVEFEVMSIIKLIKFFYSKFNLPFHIEFSTRPKKRIGTKKEWDMAEKLLEDVLKKNKLKYKINKGDGAFYGPKIDFHVTDSLGRTWQTATIQLDLLLPERFDITYTDKDNKKKRPIILHRTILGSLERFLGIILEHYKGRLPVWLCPMQVKILSFTDRSQKYGEKILKQLKTEVPGLRVEGDFRQVSIPAKVKEAELMKVPYVVVVGDKEEKENTLAVRIKGNKKIKQFGLEEFMQKLKKEIDTRKGTSEKK